MHARTLLIAAAAGAIVSAAQAQVVINEIYENPPGGGAAFDDRYEYIELYGLPGLDLTGYALVLLKGGSDLDDDGIPGPRPADFDPGDEVPEIDEAFSLDGLTLGANGLLVIYNNNGAPGLPSFLPPFFSSETNFATFAQTHIPSVDSVGRLANDASSTYMLVRRRPHHQIVAGQSVYGPGYAWRKDVNHDVNFDGVIDFGFEQPVSYQAWPIPAAMQLAPYQMVDEVAWSHRGGQEYVRTRQNEISDTPGYNPDALSRLYYFAENPQIGHRFNSSGELRFTRQADEEWVQGTITEVNPRFNYNPNQVKGPTDPEGPLYDGSCNPDINPNCLPNPNGNLRFQDINLNGFQLTPGTMNDAPSLGLEQFRWVRGDFNFDGVVDAQDLAIIQAHLGRHLDETTLCLDGDGNPVVNPFTSETYDCYVFEGRSFQAMLAMLNMDQTDGPGGTNSPVVTQADVDAVAALVGNPCPFDITGPALDGIPDGVINIADLNFFLNLWLAGDAAADFTGPAFDGIPDGIVNTADLNYFLDGWLSNQGACN